MAGALHRSGVANGALRRQTFSAITFTTEFSMGKRARSPSKRDTLKLVTTLFCRFCRHGFADWKTSRVE
jgi:hypothetical protein